MGYQSHVEREKGLCRRGARHKGSESKQSEEQARAGEGSPSSGVRLGRTSRGKEGDGRLVPSEKGSDNVLGLMIARFLTAKRELQYGRIKLI